MNSFSHRIKALLAAPVFFWGIIVFFVFEALWFVFFMAYPMAFDEEFHIGIIRIYAGQWLPFLNGQPENANVFGAVARDPSYLFHYLMSFPYRLFALFTSETANVVLLRILNVAMFTGGILLFRKVLGRLGASPALTNTILAIFVLVPVVPWLAGTINYDNLLFLMLPGILLLAFRLNDSLWQRRVEVKTLIIFIIGCMFLALVKYAALPLLLGIVAFLLFTTFRSFRGTKTLFWKQVREGCKKLPHPTIAILLVVFIIAFGLFFERYGVNALVYKDPAPDCGTVLTVEQCKEYGPWARNYRMAQEKSEDFEGNPVIFMGEWLHGMWHRSFFAVSGSEDGYQTRPGLPVPSITGIALAATGALAVMIFFRRIFEKRPLLQLAGVMTASYIILLWLRLFGDYMTTGWPVAINGRYLIPLLPLFGIIMAYGLGSALQKHSNLKPYVAVAAILLFLCGGGVFTFVILAEPSWYW